MYVFGSPLLPSQFTWQSDNPASCQEQLAQALKNLIEIAPKLHEAEEKTRLATLLCTPAPPCVCEECAPVQYHSSDSLKHPAPIHPAFKDLIHPSFHETHDEPPANWPMHHDGIGLETPPHAAPPPNRDHLLPAHNLPVACLEAAVRFRMCKKAKKHGRVCKCGSSRPMIYQGCVSFFSHMYHRCL